MFDTFASCIFNFFNTVNIKKSNSIKEMKSETGILSVLKKKRVKFNNTIFFKFFNKIESPMDVSKENIYIELLQPVYENVKFRKSPFRSPK